MARSPNTPGDGNSIRDEVRALLDKAADLYRRGEVLAAMTEWQLVLALDPNCTPASTYIKQLEDNYDLINECLLPGGRPIDLPTSESMYVTKKERESSENVLAGVSASTLASRPETAHPADNFLDDKTVPNIPGIVLGRSSGSGSVDLADASARATTELSGLIGDGLELGDAGASDPGIALPDTGSDALPPLFSSHADLPIDLPSRSRYQPLSSASKPRPAGLDDKPTTLRRRPDEFETDDDEVTSHYERSPDRQWSQSSQTPADMASGESAFPKFDRIERDLKNALEELAPATESSSERTRRRLLGLLDSAERARVAGDFERAVIALELAFAEDPDSPVTHKLRQLHHDAICQTFQDFLGDLYVAPTLGVDLQQLKYEHIDARAAFLLSRVDGMLNLVELLDVAGMPRIEALMYTSSMVLRGILMLPK